VGALHLARGYGDSIKVPGHTSHRLQQLALACEPGAIILVHPGPILHRPKPVTLAYEPGP
jgi:hypothetical protein